jgi:outer membrane immunogenic protein
MRKWCHRFRTLAGTVMKRALLVSALMLAAPAAQAADMALKAPPPLAPACVWCGWYIGGSIGYGWGNSGNVVPSASGTQNGVFGDGPAQLAAELAGINSGALSTNPKGVLAGAHFGYNQQINRLVWGFEADYSGANITGSVARSTLVPVVGTVDTTTTNITANERLRSFGTVRGRLGFTLAENLLVYGTGGFAYGQASSSTAINMVHTVGGGVVAGDTFTPTSGSASRMMSGWTAGVGGEWAFTPHWSIKAEYLYYNLGNLNYSTGTITGISGGGLPFTFVNVAASAHFAGSIARTGISYHF